MTRLHLVKTVGGFIGADPEASAALGAFGIGELITAEVRKPRNGKHHRKAMKLLHFVYDNCDLDYPHFEDFLDDVKRKVGHVERTVRFDRDDSGEYVKTIIEKPKSISFVSMSQEQFAVFYKRMFTAIWQFYMPSMGRDELAEAVLAYEFGR